MRSFFFLSTLLSLSTFVVGQTAGPQPTLIYTYAGQSAPASLLSAISSAAAGPNALLTQENANTATAQVAPLATSATVGPVTVPKLTGSQVFTSAASGEIKPTATRPAYTNVGTIDTSMTSAGSTAAATARSGAGRNEMRVGSGLVGMIVGAVVLAL